MWVLITSGILAIALSVLRCAGSDYFFWPLHCLSLDMRVLITSGIVLRYVGSDYLWYLGHCIVCP
jgi:hypothetical protein